MHRVLLFPGTPFQIYTYGAMLSLGILLAAMVFVPRGRRIGLTDDTCYEFVGIFILATTFGGRLLHVILEWSYYKDHLLQTINLREGGLALYGAILGGTLTLIGFARVRKIHLVDLLDAVAPACILAQGIGRIGCFFNGCCYGKPVGPPWGVVFKDAEPAVAACARYPTQLYELGGDSALFAFLLWWSQRRHYKGEVFCLYLGVYALIRFAIEFWRDELIVAMGLTFAQWCALVFFTGALVGWFRVDRKASPIEGLSPTVDEPALPIP